MKALRKVVLKGGKEKSVVKRHPWIFSGAIERLPEDCEEGEILPVYSKDGKFLAQAYIHPRNSLAGRILSFTKEPIPDVLRERLTQAFGLKSALAKLHNTTGYRLINAEGDSFPGLIVDAYAGHLVVQISTWGMQKLKSLIVELLLEAAGPLSLYEKSTSSARQQEGLKSEEGVLFGEVPDRVEIQEGGIPFLVSIKEGQKTGFFLDQREMRALVGLYSRGKQVLNCFSYTGGFSLYALKGGAQHVTSVDSCFKAYVLAEKNTALSGFLEKQHTIVQADVFDFLQKEPFPYDLVIVDPPAFAKKKSDTLKACQGYKELNRKVLHKMPPASLLLTSSCSYHIDERLFQNLLFQAALEAGRVVKILEKHRQAWDHPISLYHPEGGYLKSLFLYVE